MLPIYTAVTREGRDEITEKKSRFIANVFPVSSEEEAFSLIQQCRKKYWDARHNCYAFRIGLQGEIQRFSDDGEPSMTAGKPILDVITGEDLVNTLVVVTRYFGGILLGTGGLVRAYQKAAKVGLAAAGSTRFCPGRPLTMVLPYPDLGKIQYYLTQKELPILETLYTDQVTLTLWISLEEWEARYQELIELTQGKVPLKIGEVTYATSN